MSLLGVHVDEDTVGGLALAAMAGDGVAVIDMRPLVDVELDSPSRISADSDVATIVDLLDSPKLAIGHMKFFRWRSELHAVACTERALFLAVDGHA